MKILEYSSINDLIERIIFDLESELISLDNSSYDYDYIKKIRNDLANKLDLFQSLSLFDWEVIFPKSIYKK